ncbi:glycosyltransferase family 2 protein [Jannaschia ovalis]|uniref:Glycosyltransferase family 2 protein n=1 Tax=Jannaschia ovalis TaxID=3038773 RepID=A0ABY8LBZ4_9RHOB|nr:glycosyltransferase family 2 protein [Jannaschia sp. GRR-S6-38]WGH78850.1 glycosyltransferase family 2 protein [Jannaschia sp. GRR-S6-38]
MTITVVTCLRDEGPFLTEWLAHLRALGVDRILAFTNDCADGTEAVLDALAPAGVTHVPQGAIADQPGQTPQWRAMAAAWDHPACDADWLLHLDPDEYIALEGAADLPGLIAANAGAQAIALPWRLFGWSGRVAAGEGTTPERFRRAAPAGLAYPALGSFIKTLFHREGPFTGFGIHRPRQSAVPVFHDDCGRPDPELAAAQGRILLWRGGAAPAGRMVQLNHYSVRSVEEFLVKRERGLPNRVGKPIDLTYWVERNFNQVEDDMIAPQLPAMGVELARLRALPGLAGAETASRAWHAARLKAILATPEGATLAGRLVLAGGSHAPDAALGRRLIAMRRRAEAGAAA